MEKFYITAAIPYVNGAPHIGHALEFLQTDVLARYYRLILGKDKVCMLTGADENSLKNVQAAQNEGITVKQLCDRNSRKFQDLITALNTSFDIFQRSSSKNHFLASQKLWELCQKNGDIYKRKYTGLYCVGCEQFYTKDELTPEGLCPEHLTKPQEISEENYFFRLSKYQSQILKLIKSDELEIIPQKRKNEVLSFIKSGLEDFSVSRTAKRAKNWGVPVPNDPSQIIYVWFDALNVYQSGVGFGTDDTQYRKWWPADVHLIGKGIIRFHAVYWIGILLSAHLELPKSIFVHGYITIDGQKMSKSLGNVIDPLELVKKYGVDPVRYYLLREIPTTSDGDFSERRFKEVYNADLANNLGNLVSRVAKLCGQSEFKFDKNNKSKFEENKKIEQFEISNALEQIWKKISEINEYIDKNAPWKLIKENKTKELQSVLSYSVNHILEIANKLKPFLPLTSEAIEDQLRGPDIKPGKPLFPRIV